jgi:predicted RNA-binding protein
MLYLFTVGDLGSRQIVLPAREILRRLMCECRWVFGAHQGSIKHLKPGDQVVVYVSGKGNRMFSASFTIDGPLGPAHRYADDQFGRILCRSFPLQVTIRESELWPKPVPMDEVRDSLSFIENKRDWGLYFRRGIRLLPQCDYDLIMAARLGHSTISMTLDRVDKGAKCGLLRKVKRGPSTAWTTTDNRRVTS